MMLLTYCYVDFTKRLTVFNVKAEDEKLKISLVLQALEEAWSNKRRHQYGEYYGEQDWEALSLRDQ